MSRFRAMAARLCAAFIYVQLCPVACRDRLIRLLLLLPVILLPPHSDGKHPIRYDQNRWRWCKRLQQFICDHRSGYWPGALYCRPAWPQTNR